MKLKFLKALIVLVIAVGSQDLKIATMIVGTYIIAEVIIHMSLKAIKIAYTRQLIKNGVFYQKH